MDKKLLYLALLVPFCVSASSDSRILIDSQGAGLCYALDSPQNVFCGNQTMTVDGSQDHILYMVPESSYNPRQNTTSMLEGLTITPLSLVLPIGLTVLFIMIFMIVILWLVSILIAGLGGGK
jgi:hypothetical protein